MFETIKKLIRTYAEMVGIGIMLIICTPIIALCVAMDLDSMFFDPDFDDSRHWGEE